MQEQYAGRRAVFVVVTQHDIYHSLEGPRNDDAVKLSFQTEHLFIYVINRSGEGLARRWSQVANAAMTLTQALGDEISSMRDLTAKKKATRISKAQQAANDKTEWVF